MHALRHLLLPAGLMLLVGCGLKDTRPAAEYPTIPKESLPKIKPGPGDSKPPPPTESKPPADDPKPPPPNNPPDSIPKADKDKPLSKEAAAELEKFQGAWILTNHDTGAPAKEPATGKLVVTGDKYVFTLNDKQTPGTLRLDPTKTPKEIDAMVSGTDGKTNKLAGIYELEGDTQKSIFASDGGPRPTDFTVKAGSNHQLYVFKKEKPGDK